MTAYRVSYSIFLTTEYLVRMSDMGDLGGCFCVEHLPI